MSRSSGTPTAPARVRAVVWAAGGLATVLGASLLCAGTANAGQAGCDMVQHGPGAVVMTCDAGPGLARATGACYPGDGRSGPGRVVVGPWVTAGHPSAVSCGPGQQVDHTTVQRQDDVRLPPGPV